MTAGESTHSAASWAADLRGSVLRAVSLFEDLPESDWAAVAGSLAWTRWSTADHLVDDLVSYALQVGSGGRALTHYVRLHEGELSRTVPSPLIGAVPTLQAVHVDVRVGVPALLESILAAGNALAALVEVTPATARAYHSSGIGDPVGFAAMGIVETLVHTHDVLRGTGLGDAGPDRAVVERAMARLSPWRVFDGAQEHVLDLGVPVVEPDGAIGTRQREDPWEVLLWATGRRDRDGWACVQRWRWDVSVSGRTPRAV